MTWAGAGAGAGAAEAEERCGEATRYTAICNDCSYSRTHTCVANSCGRIKVANAVLASPAGTGTTSSFVWLPLGRLGGPLTFGEGVVVRCNDGFRTSNASSLLLPLVIQRDMPRTVAVVCGENCSLSSDVSCLPLLCFWKPEVCVSRKSVSSVCVKCDLIFRVCVATIIDGTFAMLPRKQSFDFICCCVSSVCI